MLLDNSNSLIKIDVDNEINSNNLLGAKDDFEAMRIWLMQYSNILTQKRYKSIVERFYSWIVVRQNKNLTTITVKDVVSYKKWLMKPDKQWCGPAKKRDDPKWKPFVKGLSNNSIVNDISIISGMMSFFKDAGYINVNPFKVSKKLKYSYKLDDRYLTTDEYFVIRDLIYKKFTIQKKSQLLWIFDLLFYSGCRRSEVINAKQSDIFIKNGQWWLRVFGKGGKYGDIPVPDALFQRWIEYRCYWGLPSLPKKLENKIPLIIKNAKYQMMTTSNLYKLVKNTARQISDDLPYDIKVKCENLSCHWLRHSSATAQVDAGIDIRIVQANLRHSLITTTMRYLHLDQEKRHKETISKFILNDIL